MKTTAKNVICIMGPTASGKTSLAVQLAKQIGTEIISADSVQIYRRMDIGSAKPDVNERGGIVHHMIDCVDIEDRRYTVSSFQDDAFRCADDIIERGLIPIVAGGSGMYISCFTSPLRFAVPSAPEVRAKLEDEYERDPDALHSKLSNIDPQTAARLHRNDKKRIVRAMEVYLISGRPFSSFGNDFFNEKKIEHPYHSIKFGLRMDREILYRRIDQRVDKMIADGLINEAKAIYDCVKDRTLPAMQSIGYKQLFDCFDGKSTLDEAVELIKRDTRRFSKRQMTWFKRIEDVHWFDPECQSRGEIVSMILDIIGKEKI